MMKNILTIVFGAAFLILPQSLTANPGGKKRSAQNVAQTSNAPRASVAAGARAPVRGQGLGRLPQTHPRLGSWQSQQAAARRFSHAKAGDIGRPRTLSNPELRNRLSNRVPGKARVNIDDLERSDGPRNRMPRVGQNPGDNANRGNHTNRNQPNQSNHWRNRGNQSNQPNQANHWRNRDNHPDWARHRRHRDRDWWRRHCHRVVFVSFGYWAFYNNYWYPAWGYDPAYSYYPWAEPIYAYDGLPPDQVVANVQRELQMLGYFPYAVDGVYGPLTREAILNYQRDAGIYGTGAIDRSTLVSLRLVLT